MREIFFSLSLSRFSTKVLLGKIFDRFSHVRKLRRMANFFVIWVKVNIWVSREKRKPIVVNAKKSHFRLCFLVRSGHPFHLSPQPSNTENLCLTQIWWHEAESERINIVIIYSFTQQHTSLFIELPLHYTLPNFRDDDDDDDDEA